MPRLEPEGEREVSRGYVTGLVDTTNIEHLSHHHGKQCSIRPSYNYNYHYETQLTYYSQGNAVQSYFIFLHKDLIKITVTTLTLEKKHVTHKSNINDCGSSKTNYQSCGDLRLVEHWFAILSPFCEWVAIIVTVEGVQGDGEAEGVEDLVLHCGHQRLQLLGLGRYGTRTQVGVAGDGSVYTIVV